MFYPNNVDDRYASLDSFYGDDTIAKDVLVNKYLAPQETCPLDMWVRESNAAAEIEEDKEFWAAQYFDLLQDYRFLPGGRINYGLGRKDINVSFSNCYVIPIADDSLSSIYQCEIEEAKTYKVGGGCGHDLSNLRPKNSPIKGTGGNSCGPVGFMNLFSVNTNTVAQQNRRGANMQTMLVSHPDIEEFINCKNDMSILKKKIEKFGKIKDKNLKGLVQDLVKELENKRNVQFSNISVKLTDDFLNAVENDEDYDLTFQGNVYKTVKARAIWNKIVLNAWESAEPGIIFWDRMVETNNLEYINPILSTNPCSEIPLGPYGNCLLGHMNLTKFVVKQKDGYSFDLGMFSHYVGLAVRFLDNIITLNDGRHALPKQNEVALGERRTGLGITGLADMLVMVGLRYGSSECIEFLDVLGQTLRNSAYNASCDLALERGAFPWFDVEGFFKSKFAQNLPEQIKDRIKSSGIRNGMILTVAPVGSGSIIAQTSSGIEPIFNIHYKRKVRQPDGNTYKEYSVFHPMVKKLFPNFTTEESISSLPDYVVDSADISPKDRVLVQATIQKYIDNSISSTVNLPKEATLEDVAEVYLQAWKLGCKGITVYREGTRDGVLVSSSYEDEDLEVVEERYALKRPVILRGETYKRKIDINGQDARNCYITVNFFPDSDKPYELLISEPHVDKDIKDVIMLELATRCTSMLLRHNVPINIIVEQFEKIKGQYIYSIPVNIANVLKNYIDYSKEESGGKEKCPMCGGDNLKRENGCVSCLDCGKFDKCS